METTISSSKPSSAVMRSAIHWWITSSFTFFRSTFSSKLLGNDILASNFLFWLKNRLSCSMLVPCQHKHNIHTLLKCTSDHTRSLADSSSSRNVTRKNPPLAIVARFLRFHTHNQSIDKERIWMLLVTRCGTLCHTKCGSSQHHLTETLPTRSKPKKKCFFARSSNHPPTPLSTFCASQRMSPSVWATGFFGRWQKPH